MVAAERHQVDERVKKIIELKNKVRIILHSGVHRNVSYPADKCKLHMNILSNAGLCWQ